MEIFFRKNGIPKRVSYIHIKDISIPAPPPALTKLYSDQAQKLSKLFLLTLNLQLRTPRTERNGMTVLLLRTERKGTERNENGKIKKRKENGTIYLKALVLERNGTISKKSERAQP